MRADELLTLVARLILGFLAVVVDGEMFVRELFHRHFPFPRRSMSVGLLAF